MLPMRFPVLGILGGKGLIADEQEIFRVFHLGRYGEVETSRDDEFTVNDDYPVVRDRVVCIDHRLYPLIRQAVGRGIFLRTLTFIEDDLYLDTTLMRVEQGFGNRG